MHHALRDGGGRFTLKPIGLAAALVAGVLLAGCNSTKPKSSLPAAAKKINDLRGKVNRGDSGLEATLTGWKGEVTDYALLAELKELTVLHLGNADVTGATLKHVAGLTSLVELDLDDSQVDDDGLKHLGDLKKLKTLRLRKTLVSEKGLPALEPLVRESLEFVDLRDTKVPKELQKKWKHPKKE